MDSGAQVCAVAASGRGDNDFIYHDVMMESASVVIVAYHTGAILLATLKSVLRQSALTELILVDNGNPPDMVARLQQMALTQPRLKIITGHGNIGLAKARNLGAKRATGELLVFMHPDCLLPPGGLRACLAAFAGHSGLLLADCAVMDADGRELAVSTPWLLRRLRKGDVPTVSPRCMCILAKDLGDLGGFDEGFFLQGADMDLCTRVQAAGGVVQRIPGVRLTRIYDLGGRTPYIDKQWLHTKGMMRYATKYFKGRYFPGDVRLMHAALLSQYFITVAFEDVARWFGPKPDKLKTMAYKRLAVLASGLAALTEHEDFKGKVVFVTGATSETGLCVVRRLMAGGAAVLALSRGDAIPFEHEQLRWIKDDLDNKECNLHGYYADIAVHCAPLGYLTPAMPMLKEAGVKRVIAFGSTAVFAKPTTRNSYQKELTDYLAAAEKAFEAAANEAGMDWTLLRPTMVYGVGLDRGVTLLYKIIRRLGFMPIYPPASGRCHPVHADDLALAVVQAVNEPKTYGKSYNLSGGEILTYRQILERLFGLCRKPVRIIGWPLLPAMLDLAGKVMRKPAINGDYVFHMNEDLLFFHEAAKKDFGFQPRAFLSGGIQDLEGY